jgi:thioredoxin reductase
LYDFSDLARIPPSPLNRAEVSGSDFSALVRERLVPTGIVVDDGFVEHIVESAGFLTIVMDDGRVHRTEQVVFAPVGNEVGASDLGAEQWYGVGVSVDAASDAPFLAGLRVAVLGGGVRAAEEALTAIRAGVTRAVILCEHTRPDFGALTSAVAACSNTDVVTGARAVGLKGAVDVVSPATVGGALQAVSVCDSEGHERDVHVAWLFLARGLECDWSVFGGAVPEESTRIVRAGLAAGVPYGDRPAMIRSAQDAAEQVMAARARPAIPPR